MLFRSGLGMALGSWSGGAIFDLTGSYRWALALSLICFVVSFLAIHAGTTWHRKQELSRTADETSIAESDRNF